jgi:hypothetical protein
MLILKRVSDEKQIVDFLSIARSSAHLWSVSERKVIHLPRHFVPPKRYDSPLSNNYAPAVARYRSWRDRLSSWIYVLFPNNFAVIELCTSELEKSLGGLAALRQCAWVIATVESLPLLAQYADREISANSLPRTELRRLFPQGEFLRFDAVEAPAKKHLDTSTEEYGANSEHESDLIWIKQLLTLAKSKSPQAVWLNLLLAPTPCPFLADWRTSAFRFSHLHRHLASE